MAINSRLRQELRQKSRYSNGPKYLDRQVWTNIVDPDQTAPEGSGSTLFAIPSASFKMHFFYSKIHCLNFRIITAVYKLSRCTAKPTE